METEVVDDFLEHYGVKGMKWGVRKSGSSNKTPSARQARYDKIRNREMNDFSVKTALGETVDVKQKPDGKLSAYVSSLSKMGTKDAMNTYEFEFSVGGKTIGQASMDRRSKDELYLNWLGVDSSQRGKGYGSAVFDAAVKHGQETGAKKLTLEVPLKSPDARHIYEKQGFVVTREPTKKEAANDPVWGGLADMELDLTKRSIRHALSDEDEELERALFESFATLPAELEAELFGESDELEQSDTTTGDFLAHYGVKGMKWGRRKAQSDDSSGGTSRSSGSTSSDVEKEKRRLSPETKRKLKIGAGIVGAAAVIAVGAYAANKQLDANKVKKLSEMRRQVETRRAGEAAAKKQLQSLNGKSKLRPSTYSKATRNAKREAAGEVKKYDDLNAARRQAFADRTAANRQAAAQRQRRVNSLTRAGRARNRETDAAVTRQVMEQLAKRSKWEVATSLPSKPKTSTRYSSRDIKKDTKLYGAKGQARIQKRVDKGATLSSARQKEATRQYGMKAVQIALNVNSAQRREGAEYDRLRRRFGR